MKRTVLSGLFVLASATMAAASVEAVNGTAAPAPKPETASLAAATTALPGTPEADAIYRDKKDALAAAATDGAPAAVAPEKPAGAADL